MIMIDEQETGKPVGKRVTGNTVRGFESLPFRHTKIVYRSRSVGSLFSGLCVILCVNASRYLLSSAISLLFA